MFRAGDVAENSKFFYLLRPFLSRQKGPKKATRNQLQPDCGGSYVVQLCKVNSTLKIQIIITLMQ